MEIEPSSEDSDALRIKSDSLKILTLQKSPISSSISNISSSSRVLPSEKDFHFYYNFDEFRAPLDQIAATSQSMLQRVGEASPLLGGKEMVFPQNDVEDESFDWLVNVNDELIERFDVAVDEFSRLRKAEEDAARARPLVDGDGFQLVCGRKMKAAMSSDGVKGVEDNVVPPTVRVADKKTVGAKPKVPFHIPTIRRPQDEYNILVNNSNQPFQHVWLERSEDGSRFIHPLEKLSVDDFVDKNIENLEPMKPPPVESTPFKIVEEVKDLKEMASKLRVASEIAVDLEHNQYRSFQGLTCLMQISTRTEDFIVDTLKLRIHVGPYLREVFKDPTKKKVMHGADRDIIWLQRDFGIYVCNLFDTGQASRVLQMERHSLEHLLQHFCGVAANKEYQNADWRLRPLPSEMLRYAREDTHYLLYIYDLMRIRLLSESTDPENPNALLSEVYKRSFDLCMHLYEKELLTDTSYLYIFGVQGADLNAQQLSVVAGLCQWRDAIARQEDESTGYILPNKLLLEIGKQMPLTINKLKRLFKSKHPYVERNLSSVVNIIRHSVQNSTSFEEVAQQLKEGRIQAAADSNPAEEDFPELQTVGETTEGYDGCQHEELSQNGSLRNGTTTNLLLGSRLALSGRKSEFITNAMQFGKVAEASVQVLKKPGGAFGALLGSSISKKKIDPKKDNKLEQIKSSVNLPFYSFSQVGKEKQAPEHTFKDANLASDPSVAGDRPFESVSSSTSEDVILLDGDQCLDQASEEPLVESESVLANSESSTKLADVILLDSDSNEDEEPSESVTGDEHDDNTIDHRVAAEPELVVLDEDDNEDQPMSLTDLSSSFEKCSHSADQDHTREVNDKPEEGCATHFKPFDYEAARKHVQFGVDTQKKMKTGDENDNNSGKKKVTSRSNEAILPQGKRRQAFPASGNRSATFR